jgi:hypothetical protein
MEAIHFRAEAVDFLADLDGKFASWAEDKNLRVSELDVQFRECGERESCGFSRAGCGKSDEVFAKQGRGDAHRLDRRRTLVTESFNGGEQSIGQSEFGKRRRIHEQIMSQNPGAALDMPRGAARLSLISGGKQARM